jgi:hypothetical protein
MRIQQLNEYNEKKIIDTFGQKLMTRWEQENKPYSNEIDSPESIVKWIEKSDPSPTKQYMTWLVQRYVSGNINKMEDIPARSTKALNLYMKLGNKKKLQPEHTDINRIKTLPDLEDVIDTYREVDTSSNKEQEKSIEQGMYKSGDAKLVHNDATYKVVIPITHKASCYFGKNTKWCTTTTDDDSSHDEYAEQGDMYIVLHKATNARWQFHFETGSFMDENDSEIEIRKFLDDHPVIAQVFVDVGVIELYDGGMRLGSGSWEKLDDDGEPHNESGPAQIFYHDDNPEEIATVIYVIHGIRHREDGPAYISYDEDGAISQEGYYINDEKHREDGPAIIWYHDDGSISSEEYFDDGDKGEYKRYREGEKFPDKKQNESINRLQQLAGIK